MRRADRLFRIIQLLRAGRVLTARHIAHKLEVSERTVYRDVRDLTLSGVPVEGEAGVGYTIREGYDLPPLMFTKEEIAALVIGARMVGAWGGAAHGKGAETALLKIESALPRALRAALRETKLFSPSFPVARELKVRLDEMHAAISGCNRVAIRYVDEKGDTTRRTLRPLGLFYWGKVWTLTAWCELRNDFRNFRMDRIASVAVLKTAFRDEPGKTLDDFLRQYTGSPG